MNRCMKRDQAGFTLVELMIALLLFSVAIAGILSVAVTMTRSFREQSRIVNAERAVRAPLDLIVDALRQASPAVPTVSLIKDGNTPCSTGALNIVDNTGAPDELEIVYASGGVATTTHSAVTASSTFVTVPSAHVGQFALDDYILISDTAQGTLLKVAGIAGNNLTIAPATACSASFPTSYPAKSVLVRAQRARFTIANLDGIPTLWMDPDGAGATPAEPVAEGVEDLQVAIGIDTNADGAISEVGAAAGDDEWYGNVGVEGLPAGTLTIRAIRVVLVAREAAPMMRAMYYAPAALNHPGTSVADKFRRRVLTSTVEIRNLTGSP